jgi:putative heme iron utilization protein
MNLATEARQFLRSTRTGILSTHSAKHAGYPFGSVAPFVLDHAGNPIILISNIAEHTKNINTNAKVSLLVFAGAEDLQANARLTLLGEAMLIDKSADSDLRARYLRYLPQAATYFDMHDFAFYRIQTTYVRYIGGFGKMSWLEADSITAPANQLAEIESDILDHMNADHADSLLAYCKHFHDIEPRQAEMIGIDCDGFDVHIQDDSGTLQILRFDFEAPVTNAQEARQALVAMSKASRA